MSITQRLAHALMALGASDALAALFAVLALVLVPLMVAGSVCGLLERSAARKEAGKHLSFNVQATKVRQRVG